MSAPYLAVADVSVRLGGRLVLRDTAFALPRRHLVALVGPNGAGKTTLLRALAGLVPADGTITVGGSRAASLTPRERARIFAYLPQGQSVHWPLPARDIVALGRFPHGATDPARLAGADAAAVGQAMAATDIVHLADRSVTALSGGERSRVLLARALAVQAPVVLADEPTTSLDPRHQLEVMRLLRATAGDGALVVIVTHDLGLAARFADTILVLHEGRLAAAGPPAQALAASVLADVFQVEAFRAERDAEPVIVPWATT
jgi:iron complex transport system ATP-binding protein